MGFTVEKIIDIKKSILKAAFPALSAAVFGDIYGVDGLYAQECLTLGCKRILLVDSVETPEWLKLRLRNPELDFYKADFSDPVFMTCIKEEFDITVAFDILLHQAPLLSTLHSILDKTRQRICIFHPMIKEQEHANTLIYLPGITKDDAKTFYPLEEKHDEYQMFDPSLVNHSKWIWGMTPSFLDNVLLGEGFQITFQKNYGPLTEATDSTWFYYGCIAERKTKKEGHWSQYFRHPGTMKGWW
jgi:hypothetical protein